MPYDAQLDTLARQLAPYLLPHITQRVIVLGTYTPTYTGATTAGTTTYTIQTGTWTRIGNRLIVTGRVAWSAATGTGNALISLPTAADFTNVSRFPVLVHPQNVTFAAGVPVGVIDGTSASAFLLFSPASNAAGTIVAVEAAGDVQFTAIYEV